MKLQDFFKENKSPVLGFSGGVDSAYLLYAAVSAGADICPCYVKTALQPQFELDDARRLAAELGVNLRIIELDILAVPEVALNPERRCYHCKNAIFGAIAALAASEGRGLIIDGSNADDDESDRPGMQALRELSVRSPLRECGITKAELRRLSREAGLFTWDKPSYSCLATRIKTGEPLTAGKLELVERSEARLMGLGFENLRLRLRGEGARLELPPERINEAQARINEIRQLLPELEFIELGER